MPTKRRIKMASAQSIMIWEDTTVSAGASLLSGAINLGQWTDIMGYFSLQVGLTGTGTGKFQWAASANNSDFYISSDASDDIVTAHVAATGVKIYQFSPITAQWLKLKVTETGGANGITIAGYLTIH
jgi:hypothetical protein